MKYPATPLAVLGVIAAGGRGFAPTIREIAAKIDRSYSTTYAAVDRLRTDGMVLMEPGVGRTLRVTAKGRRLLNERTST